MQGTAAPNIDPNQRKSARPGSAFSTLTSVHRICRVSSIPLHGILGTEKMVDNSDSETTVWKAAENGPSWSSKLYYGLSVVT